MIAPHSSERSTFDLSNRFEALTAKGTKAREGEAGERRAYAQRGDDLFSLIELIAEN
jgi:hypothetical protein